MSQQKPTANRTHIDVDTANDSELNYHRGTTTLGTLLPHRSRKQGVIVTKHHTELSPNQLAIVPGDLACCNNLETLLTCADLAGSSKGKYS